MKRVIDTKTFKEKASIIHKEKYDYTKSVYVDTKTKLKITCPIHGDFLQTPKNHLNLKQGCSKCGLLSQVKKRSHTLQQFIQRANEIHNHSYDYSISNYINNQTKVEIICSEHGIFKQTPLAHINLKQGCPKCAAYQRGRSRAHTNEIFIEKAKIIHNDLYDYSKIKYIRNTEHVEIICKVHGAFLQTPSDHLSGCGCPKCSESKGEMKISAFLNLHNIEFITQKKFSNCKSKRELPFDFFIPSLNICIEYDGIQHFKPVGFFGGEEAFEKVKENDNIKTNFCLKNNIKLIRIKYNQLDVIELLLVKHLS